MDSSVVIFFLYVAYVGPEPPRPPRSKINVRHDIGATPPKLELTHSLSRAQALFRRGVARARLGALEDAKTDLLAVIKADPRNGGAKKELKVSLRVCGCCGIGRKGEECWDFPGVSMVYICCDGFVPFVAVIFHLSLPPSP